MLMVQIELFVAVDDVVVVVVVVVVDLRLHQTVYSSNIQRHFLPHCCFLHSWRICRTKGCHSQMCHSTV